MFSNKLFATFTAGYTRYRSHIQQDKEGYTLSPNRKDRQLFSQENHYRSAMEDVSLRASFDYRLHEKHRLKFGGDYLFHNFRPEQNTMKSLYKDSVKSQKTNTVYANSLIRGHEVSLFAEEEMHVIERLTANVGLRATTFLVQGETYFSLQPRLSARYLLARNLSAKLSYTKMNQYIHLLSISYISQPTDIWVPVTEQVPPMSSHQITAGLYYNLKRMYDFSIEGYYKRLNNLIDYKDHWPVETHFSGWEDRVGLGKGKTYGVEFMAQKTNGKTTGWIGYTLSWSDRWFPDGSVNKGRHFPFRFDNRHKVNVVVSRKLSRKVELTGAWVFASGNHISLPEYKYLSPIYQKENGYAGVDSYRPMNSGLSARNNYQLSPYHRLDLGVNFYRYKKKGRMGIWNISIYNTYLKPNPFMTEVMVNQDINQRYQVVLQETILFYCMPSVSYTYKF